MFIPESKREAASRAIKLSELYASIADAPEEIAVREDQANMLSYMIDKSNKCQLDLNDLDGLMRLGCDTEDLLTERDCKRWRANAKIWKPYPAGWMGYSPGRKYPAQLHPKEINYLKETRETVFDELAAIKGNLPYIEKEIEQLRAVGPLPKDIAERHKLTVDGLPVQKGKEPCNPSTSVTPSTTESSFWDQKEPSKSPTCGALPAQAALGFDWNPKPEFPKATSKKRKAVSGATGTSSASR